MVNHESSPQVIINCTVHYIKVFAISHYIVRVRSLHETRGFGIIARVKGKLRNKEQTNETADNSYTLST